MVVMTPREKWTDERLDDLNEKVDRGFADTKAEMKEFRGEMDARFDKVDARFDKVDARFDKLDERFDKLDERFDSLYKVLLVVAGAIIAAMIGISAF